MTKGSHHSTLDLGGLRVDFLDGGSLAFTYERPGKRLALELAVRPVLVRSATWSCLIDPGFGPADPRRRERFALRDPEPLEDQCRRLGLVDGPDHVLLTHLHFDHAAGVLAGSVCDPSRSAELRFARAQHHVHSVEWEAALREGRGGDLALRMERALAGLPTFLPDRGVVFGEAAGPRVEVELAPGHTEGLVAVWLRGARATALYAADLVPTARFLEPRVDRMADQDPELALATRTDLLRRSAVEGAYVLFYHDTDRTFARLGQRSDD